MEDRIDIKEPTADGSRVSPGLVRSLARMRSRIGTRMQNDHEWKDWNITLTPIGDSATNSTHDIASMGCSRFGDVGELREDEEAITYNLRASVHSQKYLRGMIPRGNTQRGANQELKDSVSLPLGMITHPQGTEKRMSSGEGEIPTPRTLHGREGNSQLEGVTNSGEAVKIILIDEKTKGKVSGAALENEGQDDTTTMESCGVGKNNEDVVVKKDHRKREGERRTRMGNARKEGEKNKQ